MHITIGKRRFEDLLDDVNKIEDEPGVFVVVCPDTNGGYFVVDVGESDRVKPHLQTTSARTVGRASVPTVINCHSLQSRTRGGSLSTTGAPLSMNSETNTSLRAERHDPRHMRQARSLLV